MEEIDSKHDYMFKLVLLGDAGVGKSSLLIRFADYEFSESHIATIGVDFRYRTVTIDDRVVKIQIWDTAGQEKFRTIVQAYYRGADGVIMVFDVTDSSSFDHVEEWLADVDKHAEKDPVKLLVGNKADLVEMRQVDEEVAQKFAEEHNIQFVETSAKTATNVSTAFLSITKELMRLDAPKKATHLALEGDPVGKVSKCPCS